MLNKLNWTKTKQNKLKRKKTKENCKNLPKSKKTMAMGVVMLVSMGTTKAIVMVQSWMRNVTF